MDTGAWLLTKCFNSYLSKTEQLNTIHRTNHRSHALDGVRLEERTNITFLNWKKEQKQKPINLVHKLTHTGVTIDASLLCCCSRVQFHLKDIPRQTDWKLCRVSVNFCSSSNKRTILTFRETQNTHRTHTYTVHTHTHLTALFRDYPGEPVPER